MRQAREIIGLTVLLGAVFTPVGTPFLYADGSPWFDKAWPVRRIVAFEGQKNPFPGEEIGVVELPTDGLAQADGKDIRVANSIGRPVPMRLLSVGPGSLARVALAIQPGRQTYAIYYGCKAPPPLPKELELEVRRGLLLETCTFAGGDINTYAGVAAAWLRAETGSVRQGADFVPNVFLGQNIFGPSARSISRFTGLLNVPQAGDYGFATSSHDASFLLIDGQRVVEWPGYHGWVADARHNRTIPLTAGLHLFEYLHVSLGVEGGAVAAWKPPAAVRWMPIPPSAFPPVHPGLLKEREEFGKTTAAEMAFANIGEALLGSEDYIQLYRFTSQPTGFDPKIARFAWDFGDGVVRSGSAQVEHVYLTDGPVDVSVTVSQADRKETVTNRLVVSRNWRNIGRGRVDPLAAYAVVALNYDFSRMRPEAVARAMELFKKAGSTSGYLAAGHALAAQAKPVNDRLLQEYMDDYAESLIERNPTDGPRTAVEEYLAASERAAGPFAKAAMLAGAGRVVLERLGNDARAEQFFRAALQFADRGNDPSIRSAWIGLGDVHRRRGDGEKARSAYASAERLGAPPTANQAALGVGSLARAIEFYIRQGDFITAKEQLRQWDTQFPTQKLNGYSTLLWVRFYQAQRMHKEAIQEANDLVAASERSNYAPELLILAAESWLALRQPDKARQLLEHVATVYRDSPLAGEARKRLNEMGRP